MANTRIVYRNQKALLDQKPIETKKTSKFTVTLTAKIHNPVPQRPVVPYLGLLNNGKLEPNPTPPKS